MGVLYANFVACGPRYFALFRTGWRFAESNFAPAGVLMDRMIKLFSFNYLKFCRDCESSNGPNFEIAHLSEIGHSLFIAGRATYVGR